MKSWIAFSAVALAGAAQAVALVPMSYDMHNGDGKTSGGTYNYWDLAYSGSGSTNVDDALLAGGRGDLTDGVITTQNWNSIENEAGSGPYVGWQSSVRPDPLITFAFAGPVDIDTIRIHADDSGGYGNVSLPTAVTFSWSGGTTTRPVVDPDPGSLAPSWLTFAGLGIANAPSVGVGLAYGDIWLFVDEIAFASAVPEPAGALLLALGLGAIGLRRFTTA